jgi:hypothetical protein
VLRPCAAASTWPSIQRGWEGYAGKKTSLMNKPISRAQEDRTAPLQQAPVPAGATAPRFDPGTIEQEAPGGWPAMKAIHKRSQEGMMSVLTRRCSSLLLCSAATSACEIDLECGSIQHEQPNTQTWWSALMSSSSSCACTSCARGVVHHSGARPRTAAHLCFACSHRCQVPTNQNDRSIITHTNTNKRLHELLGLTRTLDALEELIDAPLQARS